MFFILVHFLIVLVIGGEVCQTETGGGRVETHNLVALLDTLLYFNNGSNNSRLTMVSDWDGVHAFESIKVLMDGLWDDERTFPFQPVLHQFCAHFGDQCDTSCLYPNFFRKEFLSKYDDFLESILGSDSAKFCHIAMLEANMKTCVFEAVINEFLNLVELEKIMFFPMLDFLQAALNHDIEVFIVTGSNPLFVHGILKKLSSMSEYGYDFSRITKDNIVGNEAVVVNGSYIFQPEQKYVRNEENEFYCVNGIGKKLAIERYIMEELGYSKPIIVTGNSNGDCEMVEFVYKDGNRLFKFPEVLGVAVNPSGDRFKKIVKDFGMFAVEMKPDGGEISFSSSLKLDCEMICSC